MDAPCHMSHAITLGLTIPVAHAITFSDRVFLLKQSIAHNIARGNRKEEAFSHLVKIILVDDNRVTEFFMQKKCKGCFSTACGPVQISKKI